jgi:hypothetical protein
MQHLKLIVTALLATALATAVSAQTKPALPQLIAGLRESLARNQAQLRQYQWTETTEMSIKGELKKRSQNECRYSPDGKVQKTPLGSPSPSKAPTKGLKGKIASNKIEDMKEYMDRVGSLVHRYVPPEPQALKAAFESGKASLEPAEGTLATISMRDYAKPGDKVTLVLDSNTKQLRSFRVATYLDTQADAVSLEASFSSLGNGVSFMEQSVLRAAAKEVEIKTTNFGHHQ